MGIYIVSAEEIQEDFEKFLQSQEGEIHKDTLIEAWNNISKEQEWNEEIIDKESKKSKEEIFVEHIQNHLEEGQEVICKICNKSVDKIYEEDKSLEDGE